MQISITARHVNITEPFKVLVNEKLTKLTKYNSKIEKVRAVFSLERINYVCEIVLTGKKIRIASIEKETDLKASFNKCIGNLQKRLKKFRGMARKHKLKGLTSGLNLLKLKKAKAPVKTPCIIKTDSFALKPMLPEDAAMELDLFSKEFIVFRNSGNENVNVLYRRKDGNYGLIEP